MYEIAKVRQMLQATSDQMLAILNRAEAEGRARLNDDEDREYSRLETEYKGLKRDEARIEARVAANQIRPGKTVASTPLDSATCASAGKTDNGGFNGLGEFLGSLYRKTTGKGLDDRLGQCERLAAAVQTGTGSAGGFAVPSAFVVQAFAAVDDGNILLNVCDRVPMTSSKVRVPVIADDSHATSPYGIVWKQIAESETFGDPQRLPFARLDVEAKKSGAYFSCSNEWLADAAPEMRTRLETAFVTSMRFYVESQLWNGTGSGVCLGALVGPGALTIDAQVAQAPGTILHQNIVNMWARLRPGSHTRARWAANQTALPQLMSMVLVSGTGGFQSPLVTTSGNTGTSGLAICGKPCDLSEHLPALGDSGDLVLYDPLLYILGERQQIVVDASAHVRHQYDETTFRVQTRFDAMPVLNSTFTPANGDTCGWLVRIEDR